MIFKTVIFSFVVVITLFLSACNSSSSTNAQKSYVAPPLLTPYLQKSNLKAIIPLYLFPGTHPQVWQRVLDYKAVNKNIDMVVIANPDNGDFTKVSHSYLKIIKDMNSTGIRVLGYIHTSYGKRDINDVEANIDSWTQFYKDAGVSGIFFDEAPSKNEKNYINYYKELYSYAKAKGYSFIVLNAGTNVDNTYIDNNVADMIISYEKPAQQLFTDKHWTKEGKYTSLGMLAYNMNDDNLNRSVNIALQHHFKYIYFLNKFQNDKQNRWGAFSKYLSLQAPYLDNSFTKIVQNSTLETPEGNASNLKNIANRYFYLQENKMKLNTCSKNNQISNSILTFKDKFMLTPSTKKELNMTLEISHSQNSNNFTFINLMNKETNSSLLKAMDQNNNLKVIMGKKSKNIGKITNNPLKIKISISNNKLTFSLNGTVVFRAKDISSLDDNHLYFQVGTSTQVGCGAIAISKISY